MSTTEEARAEARTRYGYPPDARFLAGAEWQASRPPALPIPATGEVEWSGQIVTASFEDGQVREPYCGLEDCDCPDHEGSPIPAGTYITVRLDEDHPVRLCRVTVREVTS